VLQSDCEMLLWVRDDAGCHGGWVEGVRKRGANGYC